MSERYQIFESESPIDSQQVAAFLSKEGNCCCRWSNWLSRLSALSTTSSM